MAANSSSNGASTIYDFVCTACGCTCDDLTATVDAGRIMAIAPSCPLAEAFLLSERDALGASCLIDGNPADFDTAIAHAVTLLRAARAPLVMGLECADCDAQRHGVEIADRLGAFLDPTNRQAMSRSHGAMQTAGAVTATLGEVAQRSDAILYWECDPESTHPRHMDRIAGLGKRQVIVVDNWPSPSAALAGQRLLIPCGSGLDCLWTLRALVRGAAVDANVVEARTGNPLDAWRELADRLRASRYAAIFYDDARRVFLDRGDFEFRDSMAEAKTQAITELVRDLHAHTRAAALPLGAPFNAAGAAQVLTWQTGFPAAISFARGYPQHLPREATAERLLARGEVDAVLVIAADPLTHLPAAAQARLRSIPLVALDDRASATVGAAAVAFLAAPFGVATPGVVFRSDGVALPLRPACRSARPTAAAVLAQVARALADQASSAYRPANWQASIPLRRL